MERARFTTEDPGEDVEIAGIRYQPNNSERVYRIIKPEGSGAATDWATLEPDPRNHYDSYAVEVRAFSRMLGYLPSKIARRYQDYTLEADRLNSPIEVPMRLRARNYRGELRVLGSIYLPDLDALAQKFPNVKAEDPPDDEIPAWADGDRHARRPSPQAHRPTLPPLPSPPTQDVQAVTDSKKSSGGCCAVLLVVLALLAVQAIVF